MTKTLNCENNRIEIPENAERCVILARHSFSVQEGDDRERTLEPEGVALCIMVRSAYIPLMDFLIHALGPPAYVASTFPRSLLTNFLVTNARHITQDARLNVNVYLKKAPALNEKPISKGEKLAQGAADTSLFGDQPAEDMLYRMQRFVSEQHGNARAVFAAGHEHNISLTAASYGVPADLLDLRELQAFVFFANKCGIVSVQKFEPEATR